MLRNPPRFYLPITHWVLDKEKMFLLIVDLRRNAPKKGAIPLLILREYVVPLSGLGTFSKVKDGLKESKSQFNAHKKAFDLTTGKAPKVWHYRTRRDSKGP